MTNQSTLVLIKPDGYQRSLACTILARFESRGLAIKEIRVSGGEAALIGQHYPADPEWLTAIGTATLSEYTVLGIDPAAALGTADPGQAGQQVRGWVIEYMLSAPIIAAVLQGDQAVAITRAMIGDTQPARAAAGTIRGDYSSDSVRAASIEKRAVRNLVHASGNPAEAPRELALWFPGHDWDVTGNLSQCGR